MSLYRSLMSGSPSNLDENEAYTYTFKDFIGLTFQYHPHDRSISINNHPISLDASLAYTSSLLPKSPIKLSHVITGNTDGVALPWFNMADACLFSAQIHHEEVSPLYVQTFYRPEGDSTTMYILPSTADGMTTSPDIYLLAVTLAESGVLTFSFPSFSYSPSTTYAMRSKILSILAAIYFTFEPFETLVLLAVKIVGYILRVLFVVWLYKLIRRYTRKKEEVGESSQSDSRRKGDGEVVFNVFDVESVSHEEKEGKETV